MYTVPSLQGLVCGIVTTYYGDLTGHISALRKPEKSLLKCLIQFLINGTIKSVFYTGLADRIVR